MRSTIDPKVSVKVSRECSTIFSSVNTSQVGRGMSRERNEHPAESEMEGIKESSIYWHCCSEKKKKKTNSGTGTEGKREVAKQGRNPVSV